ncbi:leucine-rich repeat domain-containing protein [Calycomorphotria hydatis]|uniref:Internalin-A n=1 Tax=Calycomorphotria hydatis TaxID=2528027 RepID=A0A517T5V6_9PLAN|nr:leucine-rich repeat domain-containing protein [Calycomorphotria hydatis]QDT63765.1 Internalin-A precursor [Calycomorphotria hydatis]
MRFRNMASLKRKTFLLLSLFVVAIGCGTEESTEVAEEIPRAPVAAPVSPGPITIKELREKLGANDNAQFRKAGGEIVEVSLFQSGVTDIEPLAGLPLKVLDLGGLPVKSLEPLEGMPLERLVLEETEVADLTPLKGMPLTLLYLQNTNVTDLSPLEGMPLTQLNLMGTSVKDYSVVLKMPLETLWLPKTDVRDLSPFSSLRLVSLDIQETPVEDLSPLAKMNSLQRLNIAGSEVTDLTPLAGLSLERLIFTPDKITKGLDALREMNSLTQLGEDFSRLRPPAQFWADYPQDQ